MWAALVWDTKIRVDLLKGFQSNGGLNLGCIFQSLNLGGKFPPNFQCPHCVLDANTFCICKNGTDLVYHHTKFGWARISHAVGMGSKK